MKKPASLEATPNIPFNKQTVEQLNEEKDYWQNKINATGSWGSHLSACQEFIDDINKELTRRNTGMAT